MVKSIAAASSCTGSRIGAGNMMMYAHRGKRDSSRARRGKPGAFSFCLCVFFFGCLIASIAKTWYYFEGKNHNGEKKTEQIYRAEQFRKRQKNEE